MSENIEKPTVSTEIPKKRGRGRPKKVQSELNNQSFDIKDSVILTQEEISGVKTPKTNSKPLKSKLETLNALLKATNAKYNTLDDVEYRNRIEHMNLTDLQDECMRVGLKPNTTIETKGISIETLMTLFYDNKRAFMPDESAQNKTVLSDDRRANLLELMKSAR